MTDRPVPTGPAAPDLTIIETRVYRGPNVWSYDQCVHLLVDLGELEQWPSARIPGFVDAEVLEVVDPPAAMGQAALSVRYRVHSMAALQDYFEHRAAAMREDGRRRFGDRFRAERRVLRAPH